MSKKVLMGIGVVGLLIMIGVAAYVLRPTAEASAPIEAIPVEMEESESAAADSEPADEMAAVEGTSGDDEAKEGMAEVEQAAVPAADGVVVFSIVQAESEVRFILDELLSGVPTTVVGATDQVAGEIAIDPADPAGANVGVILVNARTFVTDNDFRNRAINNTILQTSQYEFVTFSPMEVIGFPADPALDEALEFQVRGELTVRDISHPITFDVAVTAVSETRLEGSASAILSRADYDLQIPEAPRVADVDEEVLLEIDFVAVTQ